MSDIETKNEIENVKAFTDSVNEATEKFSPEKDFEGWVMKIGDQFVQKKVARFPALCKEVRYVNWQLQKDLFAYGNKGKYTDSYGWSKSGEQKITYNIPRELYVMMTNMFDKSFWGHDNEKVYNKMLKRICRGDDPAEIWTWLKRVYSHDPLDATKEKIQVGYGANNKELIKSAS